MSDPLCSCGCVRSFHDPDTVLDSVVYGRCSGHYPSGRKCVCNEFKSALGQVVDLPPPKRTREGDLALCVKFWDVHATSPQIWAAFCRLTLEAISYGRKAFGARMVLERVRWYIAVERQGVDFKVNNDWPAFYARLFERDYPEHEGIFEKRAAAADLMFEVEPTKATA